MIKNYLKIAWRNLRNNKVYSSINVLGLAMGVAACMLIAIYIQHETTYDRDVNNGDNVYRLYMVSEIQGNSGNSAYFSANAAATIKENIAEVEESGRLMANPLFPNAGENQLSIGDNPSQFYETGFSYADPSMLDIMDVEMVYGNRKTALSDPFTIVISESKSEKYFQNRNPVGKAIYLNGNTSQPYKIGGVMKDFPTNSHLDYDFLLTLSGVEFGEGEQTRWIQTNYYTYVRLKPNSDWQIVAKKISDNILLNYVVPALEESGFAIAEAVKTQAHLELTPLNDINLYTRDIDDGQVRGDIRFIWLFAIIGIFILVIACINFINLSTARSANRAKEVGLRKVVGSSRSSLIGQFLSESVLITLIAFAIGILIAYLTLPIFNNISDRELTIPWSDLNFLSIIICSAVLIGLISGLYPAFYLSRFKPNEVLKGKVRNGAKDSFLRSGLVVFQFSIAIILISGTLIVNNQLNFILNADLGFEKDQVLQLYGTDLLGDKVQTFKNELKNIPGVVKVSVSDYLPIEGTKRNGNSFWNVGREKIDDNVSGQAWVIDEDYISTLSLNLLEGKNFQKNLKSNENSVIINQEMAAQLHMKDPVGKQLSRFGQPWNIVGLVEDFNFSDLTKKVEPLGLFYGNSPSIISLKINTDNTKDVLNLIQKNWKEFLPNQEFRMSFMDDSFANMYRNISRMQALFTLFAVLTIFIACLGLFTLSAYMSEQRSKEISVRKVLGASLKSIFSLMTKQFVLLIGIAFLIAVPIAIFGMDKWLQDYEYRIDISWKTFAIAGLFAITISILTVGFHAIKSAIANPIKNLRTE